MNTKTTSYRSPLIVITTLFFMWGFITCMNDILVPYLRKVFELNRLESQLVQLCFFGAYFIGSLIYFLISLKRDPISRIGYKNGILLGLGISAFACLLFYPAATSGSYAFFLIALFILGLGFTLLQIAANPYVAILGRPETASSRLNLSQAVNSFGHTIAPIIGGFLIFHYLTRWGAPLLNHAGIMVTTDKGEPMTAMAVQLPYLVFAGVFILIGVIIAFSKLPQFSTTDPAERGAPALRYRHLILGIIAIFLYVGSEVSIGSVAINYMKELVGYPEIEAKSFLAFYWGGAMIGRFMGSIMLGGMKSRRKKILSMIGSAAAAFAVIYFAVYIESGFTFGIERIWPFLIILVLNMIAFQLGQSKPGQTLMVFALVIIAMLIATLLSTGQVALWTILGIGLFNSIMWSNIFTLAIAGLGKHTSQGSSLLVMAIFGGAIIPPIQGAIADALNGYHYSFFVPILAYVYLAWYGWKGHKPKKELGIRI
jgi:MFS transporter, FHS family, L-fucose permease